MENNKNLWVLPTDKPSRLWMTKLGNLTRCHDIKAIKEALGNNVNIYITNDEEIKEGDAYLTKNGEICKSHNGSKILLFNTDKKIILTTDQELDGVQAIDDEFLEWFVKNPSCEECEVENKKLFDGFLDPEYGSSKWRFEYKIIIPSEEPKQETTSEGFDRIFKEIDYTEFDFVSFKIGVEWQQERSYSEQEVYDIVQKAIEENSSKQLHFFDGGYSNPIYSNLKKWLEQFKKK